MVRFQQVYPDVEFDVVSASAPDIIEKIERGLVDFGLITGVIDLSRLEFINSPIKERVGVLVRDEDPLASKEEITPEDLKGVDLIISNRGYLQETMEKWLHGMPHILMTYNLINNAAEIVREAKCACFSIDLNAHYDHLTFVPLKDYEELTSVFAWKKNAVLSPLNRKFLEFVREEMKESEAHDE
jgi:DNA-binding transcriptional LysR family regulator